MNNNKPHIHLSKEDLLELLSHNADSNSEFDDLDDFEREAFEGFAANTTSAEAKKIMDDVDLQLAQKLHTLTVSAENTDKKRGWLWLSLAASLALIVGLSVLFLKNNEAITEQNIALNEIEKKEINTLIPTNTEAAFETELKASEITKAPKNTVNTPQDEAQTPTTNLKDREVSKSEADDALSYKVATGSINTDNSIQVNESVSLAEGTTVESKNKEEVVMTEKNVSSSNNQMAVTVPASANTNKYDLDNDKSPSMAYNETTTNKTLSKKAISREEKAIVNNNAVITNAYYKGGEKAIKKYILNYEKETIGANKLIGVFLINAVVKTDGQLVVSTISGNDLLKDSLKEALNTMKNWKPAQKDGKAIESVTNFKLEF